MHCPIPPLLFMLYPLPGAHPPHAIILVHLAEPQRTFQRPAQSLAMILYTLFSLLYSSLSLTIPKQNFSFL